jgi:hypothetical protein
VAGLQALAKAHGGTLTVNTDTGLPEAGFLKSILPMVIGAGLSVASGGTLTPLMAAMMTGGGYGLAKGSLKEGLMAGLGAYGGAGLAGGLMGAGTGALSSTAGAAGANAVVPAVADAGVQAAIPELVSQGTGVTVNPLGAEAANLSQTGSGFFGGQSYFGPGQGAEAMTVSGPVQAANMVPTTTPIPATPYPTALSQNAADIGNAYAQEQAAQNAVANRLATATPTNTLQAGLGQIGKNPSQFMTADNLKYGLAGLAPMLFQDPKPMAERPKDTPRDYDFSYNRVADPEAEYTGAYTGQRTYFNPTFTERKAAGGGLMDIGPIEALSDRNQAETLMANGGQMFAEGGETKAVQPVEQDPYYTMSGQSGDAFKYLMGQMPAPSRAAAPVQPSAPATSGALGAVQSTAGAGSANATMRPYTFDPATGRLVALPVIAPAAADVSGTGFYYDGGGGYGGDSGGVAASSATGEGGGMSNSGEGGGAPGEGGWARGGIASLAQGGPSHLGDYSDGGRLLKGPGDGVSDSIPATIANKRPARLADGEFVVPARIVSEIGNGSTEAGARKLYAMMDRVQKARGKTTGKNRVAVNSRAEKMLPA